MNDLLKDPEIIAALQTLGKNLKTPAELVSLNNELTKITIEAAFKWRNECAFRIRKTATIQATAEMATIEKR